MVVDPPPSSQNVGYICFKSSSLFLAEWVLPALIIVVSHTITLSHRKQVLRLVLNVYIGNRTGGQEGWGADYPSCLSRHGVST